MQDSLEAAEFSEAMQQKELGNGGGYYSELLLRKGFDVITVEGTRGGYDATLQRGIPASRVVPHDLRLPLTLSIAGALIVTLANEWEAELVPMLQAMAGLPVGPETELLIYEEVKTTMVEEVSTLGKLGDKELQTGDIIAQLNPERFELALESAHADHELAEKTLSRVESLKASGTVSQAELDEAMARAKLTGLTVESAQKDLDDTLLRAPFAGQLTKRLVENFSPVARLSPVIRLAPVERIEVVIGVPEQLMARLNPATLSKAAVRFTADPDRLFEAQWLDYEAEASRDTQTYDVRFSLIDTPPWPVLPGMTATALLSMATPDDSVIQLPLSAVQSDAAGNFFVWTVERDSSVVAKRPIAVGVPSRKHVPVLSGLEIGEQVVAAGGAWLYDGMQVRPLGDG